MNKPAKYVLLEPAVLTNRYVKYSTGPNRHERRKQASSKRTGRRPRMSPMKPSVWVGWPEGHRLHESPLAELTRLSQEYGGYDLELPLEVG